MFNRDKTHTLLLIFIIFFILYPILNVKALDLTIDYTIYLDNTVASKYIVGGVILTIPGAYSIDPIALKHSSNKIIITFSIHNRYIQNATEYMKNTNVYPTITILLYNYNDNRSASIILRSEDILLLNGIAKSYRDAYEILRADPLAALKTNYIIINSSTIDMLHQMGAFYTIDGLPGDRLPIYEWENINYTTNNCNFDSVVDPTLGIYYDKNLAHPAANQAVPQWFRDRFIQYNWLGPDYYWSIFRDRLVAAYYYVPENVELNTAILRIADWALHPSDPEWRGGASILSMEAFVGTNSWIDSLPPIVYEGWITLFAYKTTNHVGTEDSKDSLMIRATVCSSEIEGHVSGLLLGGAFIATQSSTRSTINDIPPIKHKMIDKEHYFAVQGTIFSPGDYVVTVWKQVGTLSCGGSTYRVIVPQTLTIPLYSQSLDFSSLSNFSYNPMEIDLLSNPDISILLSDYKYNPETYREPTSMIYEIVIKNTTAGLNYGYSAVLGNPVFSFVLSIFGAVSGPYESLVVELASLLLDTGYVNVNFQGGGVLIRLWIEENLPPEGYYSLSVLNEIPKGLDGFSSIDGMVWNTVYIDLYEDTPPPDCGPTYCPYSDNQKP